MVQDLEKELWELFDLPKEEEGLKACLTAALQEFNKEAPGVEVQSIRSPLLIGLLTSHILSHPSISREAKLKASWAVFDAIPLPEREDEAFLTEESIPPGLQEAAHFLLEQGEFVEYNLLHLIYALYLDPTRASKAAFPSLKQNVASILSRDFNERLKLLYAYLLLSSPSLSTEDASRILSTLLESSSLSVDSKSSLCLSCVDSTFSTGWFVELATVEGLYSSEAGLQGELLKRARVRPLPHSLSPEAQKWLLQADPPLKKPSSEEEG